jgi:hypothetical protein
MCSYMLHELYRTYQYKLSVPRKIMGSLLSKRNDILEQPLRGSSLDAMGSYSSGNNRSTAVCSLVL